MPQEICPFLDDVESTLHARVLEERGALRMKDTLRDLRHVIETKEALGCPR